MWDSSKKMCLAVAAVLTVALLGGRVVVLAVSSCENELVTEENYDKIAWEKKTREEIDAILGPPAWIQNDIEVFGCRVLKYPEGGCQFVPGPRGRYREVRTYIGKPDKQFNRFVVKVCFSKNSDRAVDDCYDYSLTPIGRIIEEIKEKLRR
jgi:hypothetical protein